MFDGDIVILLCTLHSSRGIDSVTLWTVFFTILLKKSIIISLLPPTVGYKKYNSYIKGLLYYFYDEDKMYSKNKIKYMYY